jgi:hypothetical protein
VTYANSDSGSLSSAPSISWSISSGCCPVIAPICASASASDTVSFAGFPSDPVTVRVKSPAFDGSMVTS